MSGSASPAAGGEPLQVEPDPVEIRMLGPIEVVVAGAATPVAGRQTRAVLAALALRHPTPTSADELAELVWPGERPDRWEASLYAHVSRLRRLLGSDRVVRTGAGYRLEVDRSSIDLHRAADEITGGLGALDRGDPDLAVTLLGAATARWRGPALRELEDLPFADDAARRCASLRTGALEALVDALVVTGRPLDGAAVAEVLVGDEPWNEDAWARRVGALARAGRVGDARRVLVEATSVLERDVGAPTGPALGAVAAALDATSEESAERPTTHHPPLDIDALDREARWAVVVLAVAGGPVSADVLGAATEIDPPALIAALDRARRAGWLDPDGPLRLVDDEAVVALRDRLGDPERALVLRRLAAAARASDGARDGAAVRWTLGAVAAGHPLADAVSAGGRGIVDAVRRGDLARARELTELVAGAVEDHHER
ncbi:MAG TPA: BTAD domain-containing putative transcriptional regulator [Acidimicrobiales bacterium]|nr:BTAD domain-containing putative transcriptional regulator [Acidimicrobiales bacterium]